MQSDCGRIGLVGAEAEEEEAGVMPVVAAVEAAPPISWPRAAPAGACVYGFVYRFFQYLRQW